MVKRLIKVPYYLLIAGIASIGLLLLATLMPIPGNFKVKIVKSGSMEPTIKTGGIVVIRTSNSYGVGDVITFGPDTKTQVPTTHRIVKEENGIFTTKGDANDAPDPSTIRLADIDGKVAFSVPYLGFILNFARQPLGFILLVGIPAALVIFDELMKIWREIRKMWRKKIIYREEKGNLSRQYDKSYPINVLDLRFVRKNKSEEKSGAKNSSRLRFKTLSTLLLIPISLIGLSSVSSTVSYYNENENSIGNMLRAGVDFDLPLDASPQGAGFSAMNLQVSVPEGDATLEGEEQGTEENKSGEGEVAGAETDLTTDDGDETEDSTENNNEESEEPPVIETVLETEEEPPVVEEGSNEQITEEITEPEIIPPAETIPEPIQEPALGQ